MNDYDLSRNDQIRILNEIGRITKGRYNQNLYFGSQGYNLGLLMNALKYKVTKDLELKCWIDAGDEKLNRIALYFEYGTGLNNTEGRRKRIFARKSEFMKFKDKKGKWVTAREVSGVRPIFMMTKAILSVKNEWDWRIQQAGRKLGIMR
jgi:hypothetical protein